MHDSWQPDPPPHDSRSPLERFRSKPRKTLSVTDLVSPSWCQLQYWYTLTHGGRKIRTPAMQQGSAIHQKLEDQVHVTVSVLVETKEDRLALRIMNMIQGLRTLRETGLTRELEVWGMIDGNVVIGVIDQLSDASPDPSLETNPRPSRPINQRPITDFMKSPHQVDPRKIAAAMQNHSPTIYLADIKTRSARSLPGAAAFRTTAMQLMIYRHLLSQMTSGRVDVNVVLARFGLDPEASTSEQFASHAQRQYTLRELWDWMMEEYTLTFPHGDGSIGTLLMAEYRDPEEGEVMGKRTFRYEPHTLQRYLDSELRWWRGQQEPQGVCIEEAYKCRSCEFAEQCSWRRDKLANR